MKKASKKAALCVAMAMTMTVSTVTPTMACSKAELVKIIQMVKAAQKNVKASLKVDGEIYGSVYTHGKSTLKNHVNTQLSFDEDIYATLQIKLSNGMKVDDRKIDTSNAKVTLVDGDGYYADEYDFTATELGTFKNGKLVYKVSTGEFDLDYDKYPTADIDSGREWSCLGGDGHGNYTYTLVVSGIKYNGKELAAQEIPMHVSVYGFNYTADAVSLYSEEGSGQIEAEIAPLSDKTDKKVKAKLSPVWTWIGDGEEPILCDHLADDFYITWPKYMNGKSIKASDVKVTLKSEYGDTKVLEAGTDYVVNTSKGETQIALTYQNWAFIPVYSKMTVEVTNKKAYAKKTFNIGSVYVYEAQQGGGGTTIDGTVTAYSFYGLANLESWEQLMSPARYLLKATVDDQTVYYAEDENGTGYTTTDAAEALQYDASGADGRNQQLIGNTVYITTRTNLQSVEKTIGDDTITFTQYYPSWKDSVDAGGSLLSPAKCDTSLEALPGYVIPWGTSNWITNEKWAWQKGVEEGWTGILVSAANHSLSSKFEITLNKGETEQLTPTLDGEAVDVTWAIYGDVAEGTTISQDGALVIAEDETIPQFAVTVTAADGTKGTVTVKVK